MTTRILKWIIPNKSSKESARMAKRGMRLPTCFQHILEGSFPPTFFGQPLLYVQSASKHGFSRTSPHWPAQISRVDWNSVRFFCLMFWSISAAVCCPKNDPPQIGCGVANCYFTKHACIVYFASTCVALLCRKLPACTAASLMSY